VIDEYLGCYEDGHTAENAWKNLTKIFKTLSAKLELMELDQRTEHEGDKA
jgi:hypothetical protein